MSGLGHRNDYTKGVLLESDVPAEPFSLFEAWLAEADKAGIEEPNAMTLATIDANGQPSGRVVLLRGFDASGFVFYSNYHSRKGRAIETHARVALVFHWQALERQVRIEGVAAKTPTEESDAYFHSRPVESRRGAHASSQSEVLRDREELVQRMAVLEQQWPDGRVPRPEHWGGYRVAPTAIEFWQGRASRLHDRLLYTIADGGWALSRLSP